MKIGSDVSRILYYHIKFEYGYEYPYWCLNGYRYRIIRISNIRFPPCSASPSSKLLALWISSGPRRGYRRKSHTQCVAIHASLFFFFSRLLIGQGACQRRRIRQAKAKHGVPGTESPCRRSLSPAAAWRWHRDGAQRLAPARPRARARPN